ncbi:putative plant self-incompatibility S1 [Helianthus anomalus]
MSSLLFVVALFFTPTISYGYASNSSENCILTPKWHMIVTNDLPDNINLFVHGDDMEQNVVLSFEKAYGWYFCQLGRVYTGQVTWGSKNITLDLYDNHIKNFCFHYKFLIGTQHCYWLVRSEGFYVSKHNSPFPSSNWHFERGWN